MPKRALRRIVQRVPYRTDTGWSEPRMYFDLLECGHAKQTLVEFAPQKRHLCHTCQRLSKDQPAKKVKLLCFPARRRAA